MKKSVYFLLWLVVLVVVIIVIRAIVIKSVQVEIESVSIEPYGNASSAHLSEAITFPTVSYSPESPVDTVSYNSFLDFITRTYPLVNSRLDKEIINNFSLLYRWKGSNVSLKPVVLMAHYDVVPVGDSSLWGVMPFSGRINDGYIWGRGSLDDKAGMISILEAVERLLTLGYEPQRTLYLSFGHDEEIGGTRGARAVATLLKDRGIHPEFVLDEGMAVTKGIIPMMNKPVALIGTSEKGYISVRLIAEMQGGHSSTPEKESALILLNKAIYDLVNNQMKPGISGPVDDFIRYIGPEMPFYAKLVFANKWLFKSILLHVYEGTGSGNALIRTTTAPTMIRAGIKDNLIPERAEAVINFRILPGETSADVLDHIEKVVDDARIIIRPDELVDEPSPVSPVDTEGFLNILKAIRQTYPDVVVAPTMMLGASDSRHFTIVTDNIYRFAPIVVTSEDMARIHGIDERNSVIEYQQGIGFYQRLIQLSCK